MEVTMARQDDLSEQSSERIEVPDRMETTNGTESAEQSGPDDENDSKPQMKFFMYRRKGGFMSKGKAKRIERLLKYNASQRSTVRAEPAEPVEPPEPWTKCRLRQKRGRPKTDVKCDVSLKVENTSASGETSYMMDDECSISQEIVIVKMEKEEEFIQVKVEEELHLVDNTPIRKVGSRPKRKRERARKRRRNWVRTEAEKALSVERAKIRRAERMANETAEQRSRRLEGQRLYRRRQSEKRKQEIRKHAQMLRLERLAAEIEDENSTKRVGPVELVEPPGQWTSRCRLNIGESRESLLNRLSPEIKREVDVKVESTSDNEDMSHVIDIEANISQEFVITEVCSVKMEKEEEFLKETEFVGSGPVTVKEELHFIDDTPIRKVASCPNRRKDRARKRRCNRVRTEAEKALSVERAKIRRAERMANETAEQRSRRLEGQRLYRQRQSEKRKHAKMVRLERLAAEIEEEKSTERVGTVEPVEPPEHWTSRCHLKHNILESGESLLKLNGITPKVECEVDVKVENTGGNEETSHVMDEAASISQEFLIADLCSVKMEEKDELSRECPVQIENELRLNDETEVPEDSNRSKRGRPRKRSRPLTVEEESLMLERSRIGLAERFAKKTAEENTSMVDQRLEEYNPPKRGRPRKQRSPISEEESLIDETPTRKRRPKRRRKAGRKRLRCIRVQTAEEKALAYKRARIKQAERLANETAWQRSRRLERQRLYRQMESKKQKRKREERNEMLKLKRLAAETKEEKLARLERRRMLNAKFRANLTEEEREERLERLRTERLIRLANETEEQKAIRLERVKMTSRLSYQRKKRQRAAQESGTAETGGFYKTQAENGIRSKMRPEI